MKECCKETIAKVPEDEPVFLLRGKDLLASIAVETWIEEAQLRGVPADKVKRAIEHLKDIQKFQKRHPDRCKLPD